MKLFIKIFLFIFTMAITVEEIKSSTLLHFSQEATTNHFQQVDSKIVSFVLGNYFEKYCFKEEKVVTCSERGKLPEKVAAKTGTQAFEIGDGVRRGAFQFVARSTFSCRLFFFSSHAH